MQGRELLDRLRRAGVRCPVYLYATDDYWCLPADARPALVVVNTDLRQRRGEHYVSFYVHADGRSVTYFDSLGFEPYQCLRRFWRRHNFRLVRYNSRLLQNPLSDTCGYYQIAFAALMDIGVGFRVFLNTLSDNPVRNDKVILKFVNYLETRQ